MKTAAFETPKPGQIKELFTSITPCYDLLNSVLSLRLDRSWRKWAASLILQGNERSVLDVGTGTGKFLECLLARGRFRRVCAIDLCESMLQQARRGHPGSEIHWLNVDVSQPIPFLDASFDLVTAAFTLRSIEDLERFFKETLRVLTPGGKVAFLELTRPRSRWLKLLYYPYLRFYLPLMGALISHSLRAYAFLSRSILHFDEPEHIGDILRKIGYSKIKIMRFSGGIATLIVGSAP